MRSFGFTRKKFDGLTEQGRHRHAAAWLTEVFQSLRTGRTSSETWQQFVTEYASVLEWMGLAMPAGPLASPSVSLTEQNETRARLAWLSDAIHRHRTGAGMVIRDPDLAATMVIGDRQIPAAEPPPMTYQVALDGLRSLFNIGAIFRTCEAAGVSTLILGNCPGREDPRVRKTAMGTHERIREEKTEDMAAALMEKKKHGFMVIGVETIEGSLPCHRFAWPDKAVLVFGNEEYGIAPHLLPVMDGFVHIPMFGMKNSLNVANAVSAVLFQAVFSLIS